MHVGRLILFLLALLALGAAAAPARADDISAAGRSVVRVVVIAFEDGRGGRLRPWQRFRRRAQPDRHQRPCRRQAADDSKTTAIGVVPSEGAQATRARIIAVDPARDLALLEIEQGPLTPIPLYVGPLDDGAPVAALGYPGNVDLATARSADDYINPLPPTRSVGIFSNVRPINGITTLLHTANIARGHCGGPLLDQCGRVLGVNTLITRNQDGDAPFAFAVANRELTAFLRQARQPFQAIATECVSMADRLRQDRDRTDAEARARAEAEAAKARRDARAQPRPDPGEPREPARPRHPLVRARPDRVRRRRHPARQGPAEAGDRRAGSGAFLLLLAIAIFLSRPSLATAEAAAPGAGRARGRAEPLRRPQLPAAWCRSAAASRSPRPTTFRSIGARPAASTPAPNMRRTATSGRRILVPEDEQAVAVLEFRPATGEYVVTRYLLDAQAMGRVRALRRDVGIKACTADPEARTILADQQRDIGAVLPRLPNERLVYACENQGPAPAAGKAAGRDRFAFLTGIRRLQERRDPALRGQRLAAHRRRADAEPHRRLPGRFAQFVRGFGEGRALQMLGRARE